MYGSTAHRWAPKRGSRVIAAASGALLLVLVAGCSSDSSTEDAASEAASAVASAAASEVASEVASAEAADPAAAAVATAQARLDPLLPESWNDDLETDIPLTQAPEAGKRVAVIHYNNSAAADFVKYHPEAGAALGWEVELIPVDGADPQSMTNGILRAVNEKYDFIVGQAASEAGIGEGLAAAKEAGVPVFLGSGVGEVKGAENGIYGNSSALDTQEGLLRAVDLAIVDSAGTADVLFVNAPDFPSLAPIDPAVQQLVAETCPDCSVTLLGIPASDLGGDIASNIVASLRSNPDIKYVVPSFTDLARGLPQALEAAGLGDVQIIVSQPNEAAVPLIESGEYAAGVLTPKQTFAWSVFDMMARYSVGMDVLQEENGEFNKRLWTTETIPPGQVSWDPADLQERYKQLWQVSGS
jgi:ABC-type sugar transport system substrate-binding protein